MPSAVPLEGWEEEAHDNAIQFIVSAPELARALPNSAILCFKQLKTPRRFVIVGASDEFPITAVVPTHHQGRHKAVLAYYSRPSITQQECINQKTVVPHAFAHGMPSFHRHRG